MNITFKELRDQVLRQLDETATGSPTTLALVKDAINAAHRQRCTEFAWPFMLWPSEETITTTHGTHEYALNEAFYRPLYFINRTNEGIPLREIPQRSLLPDGNPYDVGETTVVEGPARHFYFTSHLGVEAQPVSDGARVTLYSDAAGDSGSGHEVVVKGQGMGGNLVAEVITPAGSTGVTSTTWFRRIISVTKAATSHGNMYLFEGTSVPVDLETNRLWCGTPNCMGPQIRKIYILENPNEGEVIAYRFFRYPFPLLNDYDNPELPYPHEQILVWDALVQMAGYLTETTGQALGIWRQKQMEAQVALYQSFATDGQTLDAEPTYVRYFTE